MNPSDLKKLQLIAEEAAQAAARYIASVDRDTVQVEEKEAGDTRASQVVTQMDLRAQEIILKHLAPSRAEYGLALLTEESPDDAQRLKAKAFWCVDPLDGTLPFVEKRRGYAVSIALVAKDGTPLIGVVCEPPTGMLWSAARGLGIKTPAPQEKDQVLHWYADAKYLKDEYYAPLRACIEDWAREHNNSGVVHEPTGGAVLNSCWALQQTAGLVIKLPKPQAGGGSVWDYAATACLFQEAGAWVSDVHGQLLDLNPKGSLFMNEQGVIYTTHEDLAQHLITFLDAG